MCLCSSLHGVKWSCARGSKPVSQQRRKNECGRTDAFPARRREETPSISAKDRVEITAGDEVHVQEEYEVCTQTKSHLRERGVGELSCIQSLYPHSE